MFFLAGILLGLIRELLVVTYYKCIPARRAFLGSVLTLVIGMLDIGIIAKLVLDRDVWTIIGYTIGESIGTFLAVRKRR